MRNPLTLLAALGLVCAASAGACTEPDALVGTNAGTAASGAGNGTGDLGGKGTSETAGTGGVAGRGTAAGTGSGGIGSGGTRTTSAGAGGGGARAGGGAPSGESGSAGASNEESGNAGASGSPNDAPSVDAPLGAPCLPSDEIRANFNGYALAEVEIDNQTPACDSGICLVNHFQGRVSCPYGQMEQVNDQAECYLPGSNERVAVAVDPQRLARRAADTVICSCRCDGPDAGPFCACPSDMECTPLIQDLFPSDTAIAGSYCIPKGTAYDPTATVAPDLCDADAMNCGEPRPY